MPEITQDQFNRAIISAGNARDKATWTDYSRKAWYERIEKECSIIVANEGALGLPTDYTKLTPQRRRSVRLQYIKLQKGKCMYCNCLLELHPPKRITEKEINWDLFPGGRKFLNHPVHLQHNHDTDMTEGAVHAYCNAIMWQYEGR